MFDVGRSKRAQQAFAFDDITIVPSRRTRGEEQVSLQWRIDAYSEALKLAFDPRVVEFREAAEGELLGGMRNKAAITSHSTDGSVVLRFHKPSTMTRNEGRLLSLTFVAKAPGVSPVRVTMGDATAQEQSDPPRSGNGVVRVR